MTYKEIRILYKEQFAKDLKNCYIADVKRELGLRDTVDPFKKKVASAKYPCPPEIKTWLKELLTPLKRTK